MDIVTLALAKSYTNKIAINGVPIKMPQIDPVTRNWMVFNPVNNMYVDTGVKAEGETPEFRVDGQYLQYRFQTKTPTDWTNLFDFGTKNDAADIDYDNTIITDRPIAGTNVQSGIDELLLRTNAADDELMGRRTLHASGITIDPAIRNITNIPKSIFPVGTIFKSGATRLYDDTGTEATYIGDLDANTIRVITTTRSGGSQVRTFDSLDDLEAAWDDFKLGEIGTYPVKIESEVLMDKKVNTLLQANGYWGYSWWAAVGTKLVIGRANAGTSILVYDSVTDILSERSGFHSAYWGFRKSMVVVGTKVVIGTSSGSSNFILIYDSITDTVYELSIAGATAYYGDGGSFAVSPNGKVVMTRGGVNPMGKDIAIYDSVADTFTTRSLSIAGYWGSTRSLFAIGNKIIIGEGSYGVDRIAVYDTVADTLTEIPTGLGNISWGCNYAFAAVGNKVVIGTSFTVSYLMVYDSTDDSLTKFPVPSGSWYSFGVVGDKVVITNWQGGSGDVFLVYDSIANTVSQVTGIGPGKQVLDVLGNKVVIGSGVAGLTNSFIQIYDASTGVLSQKNVSVSATWGVDNSFLVVGNKIVIGSNANINMFLVYDADTDMVYEKSGLSLAVWGYKLSMALVGGKVVVGRGNPGTSIVIYDPVSNEAVEISDFNSAYWGYNTSMWVVGNKVIIGSGSNTSSVIVYDADVNSWGESYFDRAGVWGALRGVADKVVILDGTPLMGTQGVPTTLAISNVAIRVSPDSAGFTKYRVVNARIKTDQVDTQFDEIKSF